MGARSYVSIVLVGLPRLEIRIAPRQDEFTIVRHPRARHRTVLKQATTTSRPERSPMLAPGSTRENLHQGHPGIGPRQPSSSDECADEIWLRTAAKARECTRASPSMQQIS
jgi:hypothetical protein